MAGNSIRVNTDQVEEIASNLERLNGQLKEQLEKSRNTIENLGNIWSGEAAQETISSYKGFAAKYFQTYDDIIADYVKFLRNAIAQGYFETETANIELADAFK